MQDTLDRLRAAHQPVPVPLELPSHEDLVDVEEALLLSIPREMRQYLLEASDVITGSLEPVTAADPQSHTYLSDVAAQAWADGVERHLLPLCQVPRGQGGHDYYCVGPDGQVLLWQDGEMSDELWEDIWQWIDEVWLND